MSDGRIADHEVLYRRIPPGETWFQPSGQITSGNFTLTEDELGLSVYRAAIVDVKGVLSKPETKEESRVAETTVGQIRTAKNGKGDPLGLEVIPVNDENDPGHAEIRAPGNGKISKSAARALKKLFKLVEPSTMQ